MINNNTFTVFDGSDEILYSSSFNLYTNQFSIEPIGGYKMIFSFSKIQNEPEGRIEITPDNNNKIIRIHFTNFGSALGSATTDKVSIMNIGDKEILFSLYGTILNDSLQLLTITLTIYVRQ